MDKIFYVFFVFLLLLSACSSKPSNKQKQMAYPKAYMTPLYDKNFKLKDSLDWGEPLIVNKETLTNNQKEILLSVTRKITHDKGFVKADDIITNAICPGVILNTGIFYETPSLASQFKTLVQAPLTIFVLTMRTNGWIQIRPSIPLRNYRINTNFILKPDNFWVRAILVSTNKDDVTIISALQVSLSDYRETLKHQKTFQDQTSSNLLRQTIELETRAVKNLIKTYPKRPAILYAKQVLREISPSMSSSNNNPLLDEELSLEEQELLENTKTHLQTNNIPQNPSDTNNIIDDSMEEL